MLKPLLYIFYPPRFVKDMRAFRVTEFSVFVLFLIGLLLWAYAGRGFVVSQIEILFTVLFCIFSYGLYVYYKVRLVPYLTLYFSIGAIASVWSYIAGYLLDALAVYFVWNVSDSAFMLLCYALWSLIYIVLFHAICRDTEDRHNEGMVVVRKD